MLVSLAAWVWFCPACLNHSGSALAINRRDCPFPPVLVGDGVRIAFALSRPRIRVGRFKREVAREQNGDAAALETRQVVEREVEFTLRQFDLPATLPVPLGSDGATGGCERRAVDHQLEMAGRAGGVPRCHPVLGPHPDQGPYTRERSFSR